MSGDGDRWLRDLVQRRPSPPTTDDGERRMPTAPQGVRGLGVPATVDIDDAIRRAFDDDTSDGRGPRWRPLTFD